MNFVLQNLKTIAITAAISLLPALYLALKIPALKDCQEVYAKEKNRQIDEFQSKFKVGDGKRF
jgi:hypothetical protein